MSRKFLKKLAWFSLAAIILVTISPINLRPTGGLPVDTGRAFAFFIMAALFVTAYPRHALLCIVLIFCAAAIEFLQFLAPTRHARIHDVFIKSAGAAIGAFVGWAASRAIALFRL